jgi:hypothetical protein
MGAASCGARRYAGTVCGVEGGTVLNKHFVYRNIRRADQKEKLIVFIKTSKISNGKQSLALGRGEVRDMEPRRLSAGQ